MKCDHHIHLSDMSEMTHVLPLISCTFHSFAAVPRWYNNCTKIPDWTQKHGINRNFLVFNIKEFWYILPFSKLLPPPPPFLINYSYLEILLSFFLKFFLSIWYFLKKWHQWFVRHFKVQQWNRQESFIKSGIYCNSSLANETHVLVVWNSLHSMEMMSAFTLFSPIL